MVMKKLALIQNVKNGTFLTLNQGLNIYTATKKEECN